MRPERRENLATAAVKLFRRRPAHQCPDRYLVLGSLADLVSFECQLHFDWDFSITQTDASEHGCLTDLKPYACRVRLKRSGSPLLREAAQFEHRQIGRT